MPSQSSWLADRVLRVNHQPRQNTACLSSGNGQARACNSVFFIFFLFSFTSKFFTHFNGKIKSFKPKP